MTEIKEVEYPDGIWEVRLKGDELSIVDPEGRQRFHSANHAMTGVHLAMQLAKNEFKSTPNIDKALQMLAADFVK